MGVFPLFLVQHPYVWIGLFSWYFGSLGCLNYFSQSYQKRGQVGRRKTEASPASHGSTLPILSQQHMFLSISWQRCYDLKINLPKTQKNLGGGFKHFLFSSSKIGEDEPILTIIFFRWVGSTTNQKHMLQQKKCHILCKSLGLQVILRISVVPVLHLVWGTCTFASAAEATKKPWQHWNTRSKLGVKESMWKSHPSEALLVNAYSCLSPMNFLPSFCFMLVTCQTLWFKDGFIDTQTSGLWRNEQNLLSHFFCRTKRCEMFDMYFLLFVAYPQRGYQCLYKTVEYCPWTHIIV